MKSKTLYQIIRENYPSPIKADCAVRDLVGIFHEYCVGGAFCMSVLDKLPPLTNPIYLNFPNATSLQKALQHIGATAPYFEVVLLTQYNDDGRFDKAWEILERILATIPIPTKVPKEVPAV